MNQNNIQMNNQAGMANTASRVLNLQPQQVQQLAAQCNFAIQEARRLGMDTPEGQEHLKKAQRIKAILQQYQSQTQQLRQQQQAQQQQAQQQQNQQQVQQANAASRAAVQQQVQSPQIQQQPPQIGQQSPPLQQNRLVNQQGNVMAQIPQRVTNNTGASSSPVMTQAVGTPVMKAATPNSQPQQQKPQQGQAVKSPFQQLTQIKTMLSNFTQKLKDIETVKATGTLNAEQLQKLAEQETLLKEKFATYKHVALQITQELQRRQGQQPVQPPQGRIQPQRPQPVQNQSQSMVNQVRAMSNSSSPQLVQNQVPVTMANQNLQQQKVQNTMLNNTNSIQNMQFQSQQPVMQQQQQNQFTPQMGQQQISQIPTTAPTRAMSSSGANVPQIAQTAPSIAQHQQLAQQRKIPPQQLPPQQRTGTPQPAGNLVLNRGANGASSASPNAPVTNVNAAAKPTANNMISMNAATNNVLKTSVPSLPVSSTVTPKPIQPTQLTQRPSITGGQGLAAPALTTPAILKLPPYEMQSDRVLSKRKLSELVKTVGADEGDGETTIDGDVEELLLDLADEFVTNVTSFGCRLAKHRKSNSLDVKDIQLHLEKNWNIRIPGYSSDEIRNVRKWAANNAHSQRIHGIGISKSLDQNK